MKKQVYWGLGVLILLIITGTCYMVINRPVQDPETITYKGETFPIQEFYNSTSGKIWEESVPMLRHLIAKAPNSKYALTARLYLAERDENGKKIHDNAVLFERLQPLLKYHPDSTDLLYLLLRKGMHSHPEAAIRYGTEALKYIDIYDLHFGYMASPEGIHHFLGYAYQNIGDYSTALSHLNQALNLYIRQRKAISLSFKVREQIEQIHKENPILGSLSEGSPLAKEILKLPPPGETFATGHWDGDKWHRTVPPDPETIMYAGEALLLRKLYQAAFYFEKSWEEKVVILNLITAEVPYSNEAFEARYVLATHDENGERISDDALVIERLKPLLKYHPDSSFLLHALLFHSRHSHLEAAIRYGKEALKYVEMRRLDADFVTTPEHIHYHLGELYQDIGDYSTALAHLNQVLKICETVGQVGIISGGSEDLIRKHIDRIREGNPGLGPLSKNPILPEKAVIPD